MSLPQAERRAHDRYPVRTAAHLVLPAVGMVEGRAIDLGKGGAGVVCHHNVPVGSQVELTMTLPARPSGVEVFKASATVVNCTLSAMDGGFRLGLQFASLSSAAEKALRGVLPE